MDLVRRGGFIDMGLSPSVGSYLSLNSVQFKQSRGRSALPFPGAIILQSAYLEISQGPQLPALGQRG